MALPNFLIVGAAKSGTSAMTRFLDLHPEAHIPFKEPNYFSGWHTRVSYKRYELPHPRPKWYVQCGTMEEYEALFSKSGDSRARGEASVSYLVDAHAAAKIRTEFPEMKIIVLLRQPVDRAFSHFHHNLRIKTEPIRDFSRAIQVEAERLAGGWTPFLCPMYVSHYAGQLQRYLDLFPRDQIRIYLYDDWNRAPKTVWEDVLSFLEISPDFVPDFQSRHNENRRTTKVWQAMRMVAPYIKGLVPAQTWIRARESLRNTFTRRITLDPAFRRELTHAHFLDDIRYIEDLLMRDLSHWLA